MPRDSNRSLRRWLTAALGLTLAATAVVAGAQVYKWRDAEGVVHYGDRPPAGKGTLIDIQEHIGAPAPADEAVSASQLRGDLPVVEIEPLPESEAASATDDRAKRQEACANARAKVQQFSDGWRFYSLDGKSERKWLTEAERAKAEARWRQEVDKWCKQ